jgi:hypothetical protein
VLLGFVTRKHNYLFRRANLATEQPPHDHLSEGPCSSGYDNALAFN